MVCYLTRETNDHDRNLTLVCERMCISPNLSLGFAPECTIKPKDINGQLCVP
jgi:hypothetical protein